MFTLKDFYDIDNVKAYRVQFTTHTLDGNCCRIPLHLVCSNERICSFDDPSISIQEYDFLTSHIDPTEHYLAQTVKNAYKLGLPRIMFLFTDVSPSRKILDALDSLDIEWMVIDHHVLSSKYNADASYMEKRGSIICQGISSCRILFELFMKYRIFEQLGIEEVDYGKIEHLYSAVDRVVFDKFYHLKFDYRFGLMNSHKLELLCFSGDLYYNPDLCKPIGGSEYIRNFADDIAQLLRTNSYMKAHVDLDLYCYQKNQYHEAIKTEAYKLTQLCDYTASIMLKSSSPVDGMVRRIGIIFLNMQPHVDIIATKILRECPDIEVLAVIDYFDGSVMLKTLRIDIDVSYYAQKYGGVGTQNSVKFRLSFPHRNCHCGKNLKFTEDDRISEIKRFLLTIDD